MTAEIPDNIETMLINTDNSNIMLFMVMHTVSIKTGNIEMHDTVMLYQSDIHLN